MKSKIVKTFVPSILGVFTVLCLLVLFNIIFHNADAFSSNENGFFTLFLPIVTIISILIQFVLVIPFWKKFKTKNKIWGMTIVQFTAIICTFSGLIFGLLFWETHLGIRELVLASLTGVIAFSVYCTVNFLTLMQIDKHQDFV